MGSLGGIAKVMQIIKVIINHEPRKYPDRPWRVIIKDMDCEHYSGRTEKEALDNAQFFKNSGEHHKGYKVVISYKG